MTLRERSAVIELYSAGWRQCEILRALNWPRARESFVRKTIQRYQETMRIEDLPRPGRPRSARTQRTLRNISQAIRRNPCRSQTILAHNYGISQATVSRAIKDDLHLHPYRPRKCQYLTDSCRLKRLQRSGALLQRFTADDVKSIIFCDEKQFTIDKRWNPQNNRIYAATLHDIPPALRMVQRRQKAAQVLVWAAVSHAGKLALHFVPTGTSINRQYYEREILDGALLPESQRLYPNGGWAFVQDGAPAHTAKSTQAWCTAHLPNFVNKEQWPPSSPDLNPMDYAIWPLLADKVTGVEYPTVFHLRAAIQREWANIPMEVVRDSIDAWRERLSCCVRAGGSHFEK